MSLYIVTVRLPRNPAHPLALKCKHPVYAFSQDGHCAEMECPNYVSRCPIHGVTRNGVACSRKKTTGECPAGSGTCTDVTGEHHSYLLNAESTSEAWAGAQARLSEGAHITRIESTGLDA